MTTENWDLPYGDEGEAVGEFSFGDLGNIPELDKEKYNGKVIVVVGVSDAEFEGEYGTPARSLLHYMPGENRSANDPWGLLLGSNSPAITQALGQLNSNGEKPFYARIVKVQGRKYPYWTLEGVRPVFNTDGQLAGFRTKQGEIIDNTQAALPMPERKAKTK